MPPQYASSDDNSDDDDVIQPKKGSASKAPAAPASAASDESDADEASGDEYVIEKVMNHKFAGDDGNVRARPPPAQSAHPLTRTQKLYFHVKWENYPNKSDWTWEPEENLA